MTMPNIFWIDALYEKLPLRTEHGAYIATLSNGKDACVYWHGSDTEAQGKLDAASDKWLNDRLGLAKDVMHNMPDMDSIVNLAVELLAAEYGRRLSRYQYDYVVSSKERLHSPTVTIVEVSDG